MKVEYWVIPYCNTKGWALSKHYRLEAHARNGMKHMKRWLATGAPIKDPIKITTIIDIEEPECEKCTRRFQCYTTR